MAKIVLITGASSGIGKATAQLLANEGCNLILCGRRRERLEALKDELSRQSRIKTLSFDVRDREKVATEIGGLENEWTKIDILLNNAGNAHGFAPVHEGSIDDWDAMIDIKVKGLLYVSKAIVPGMVKRKSGHIINIGSIAGKEVYPNGNVYCASKYAVDAINQGMRIDLNKYGIKVTAINPGLVETEFSLVRYKGDKERANANYQGYKPLSAEDVAEVIVFTLKRPSHVNISDLLILPTAQASATIVNKDIR